MISAIRVLIGLFVHYTIAVCAPHKPGKQINVFLFRTLTNTLVKERLCIVKGFVADNRLMGSLNNNPLVLRYCTALLDFLTVGSILALHHISDIHTVL